MEKDLSTFGISVLSFPHFLPLLFLKEDAHGARGEMFLKENICLFHIFPLLALGCTQHPLNEFLDEGLPQSQ